MAPALSFRLATEADYAAYARLFLELATGDPTFSEEKWRQAVMAQMRLVEVGGEVAGYVYFRVLEGVAYVTHVVVDPRFRGQGVGRYIMDRVADELRAAGVPRWELNVKPDNAAAIGLYRAVGMGPAGEGVAVRFSWTIVDEMPIGPEGATVRSIEEAEDSGLERALGILPGLLADARRRRALPFVLEQGGTARGLVCFDPTFPGCFPVAVTAPEDLGPLLRAARHHALPDRPWLQLFVLDRPELIAWLGGRGAEERMRVLHMTGVLDPA